MADNITIKDGNTADVVMGAKDLSSVFLPKNISVNDAGLNTPHYDLVAIAKGDITGYSIFTGLGERESIQVTASGEDMWRGNELTPAPTSHTMIPTPPAIGEQMTLVSESNADNGATATGILTLRLEYLDATGAEQTEDITMNGTTTVNTVATNIRFINDMYALTVGSNGVAEGHIKIYAQSDSGLVYNMIALGGNKSLVINRMVPLGKKCILVTWDCQEGQNDRCAYRIRSTDMNGVLIPGVFCFKDTCYIKNVASGALPLYVSVPALSIIKISAWADTINAEGSASYIGVLMPE